MLRCCNCLFANLVSSGFYQFFLQNSSRRCIVIVDDWAKTRIMKINVQKWGHTFALRIPIVFGIVKSYMKTLAIDTSYCITRNACYSGVGADSSDKKRAAKWVKIGGGTDDSSNPLESKSNRLFYRENF